MSAQALTNAVRSGDADAVAALVAAGADVNARNSAGMTVLMQAAFFGQAEVARLLLANGADARCKDQLNLTALDWALRRGFEEIAELLDSKSTPAHDATRAPAGGERREPVKAPHAPLEEARRKAEEAAARLAREAQEAERLAKQERRRAEDEALKRAEEEMRRSVEDAARLGREREETRRRRAAEEERIRVEEEQTRRPARDDAVVPAVKVYHAEKPQQTNKLLWALTIPAFIVGSIIGIYLMSRFMPPVETTGIVPTPSLKNAANSNRVNNVQSNEEQAIVDGPLRGRQVTLPLPVYPKAALPADAAGPVTVEIEVNKRGNVVSARAVDGHPLLRPAAVKAARKAKFSTQGIEVKTAKIPGAITYNFLPPPNQKTR